MKMKLKKLKSILCTILAVALVFLTITFLCILNIVITNYCTTYTVIARCDDRIVMVNVINKYDRQKRNVDHDSDVKAGDVVNYYLMMVKSYNPTGVVALSDNYDEYNMS